MGVDPGVVDGRERGGDAEVGGGVTGVLVDDAGELGGPGRENPQQALQADWIAADRSLEEVPAAMRVIWSSR